MSQRALVNLSQEEALFEAGESQQEILSGTVTFEEAPQKYSDCPSKVNGGNRHV